MNFIIKREDLYKPLQLVTYVIERHQTMPILGNVLLNIFNDKLSITGTDLETELVASISLLPPKNNFESKAITVPGKKLFDICRVLPEGSELSFHQDAAKIIVKSGTSRFVLTTLPIESYPNIDWAKEQSVFNLSIRQRDLRDIIESTQFAMAQQDARQYLNGMLMEIKGGMIWVVAADGHRLALNGVRSSVNDRFSRVILPRKGIIELLRLLSNVNDEVKISISNNHIRIIWENFTFTSKLIDSNFPDYNRTIPRDSDKIAIIETNSLREALGRIAIVSNDVCCGVQLNIKNNFLHLYSRNQEHEEAEETINIEYPHEPIATNFNIHYLLDIFANIKSPKVVMKFKDGISSVVIEEMESERNNLYVIMPLCV